MSDKTFYIAKVVWLLDQTDRGTSCEITTYTLHSCETLREAMGEVVADYGEDNIVSVELTPCSEGCGCGLAISQSLANALITGYDATGIQCINKGGNSI